jgi:hypothetical protein
MGTINELNTTDTLADDDKLVIWKDQAGATRAITAEDAATYFSLAGGPYQPLDELLTAIAGLGPSTAAGDFIELTAQDTVRVRKLSVATYAALTVIPASFRFDDMLVYVAGRATDGDGGHGWWRFDAASSAAANGGTVLAPDAGTGRWLRFYMLPADVRWFGVKSDGTTDDASALSAALNTTAISWFLIPADTRINTAVQIERDNVRITGPVAQGARILLGAADIDGIVVGDGTTARDRVFIEHLGFDAAPAITKTAGAAVRFRNGTNMKLENFVVSGQFTSITMDRITVGYVQHGRIYDAVQTSGTGILVTGAGNDQHIVDVIMDNNPAAQPAYGLKVEETGAVHVYECDFLRCEYGGYFVPNATKIIENVWLENNTWDTCGTNGLVFDGAAGTTIRRVWIDGDWASTSDLANVIIGGGAGTIDGIDWDGGGILNAGEHGLDIAGGTNIRLRGLLISGNGQDTINTYHGIVVSGAVTGLAIESVRSGQFLGFANQQAYGIAITSASVDNFTITGCDLRTNATGAISNAAGINGTTKIIKDVLGYATENRGTVSGSTDGSGQITFNPGLAVTPSQIFIQAVSTNFVGAQVLSATGSSITIVCLDYAGAAVTSASVVFYWSVFA